jgi:O-antigen/teichoic acid export membrane protein
VSVKAQALSALRWNLAGRVAAKAVTWVIALYVVRILDPEVFGLMALAAVTTEAAAMLGSAGLDSALIQKQKIEEDDIRRFLGGIILASIAMTLVVYLSADAVAGLYGKEQLALMIRVLGLRILIGTFSIVPRALLRRHLEYRKLAFIDLVATLIGSMVILGMAVMGYGVWSLIAGALAGSFVSAWGVAFASRVWIVPNFGLMKLAPEFRFGAHLMAQSVVAYLGRRMDTILIGRLLGAESLGFYTIGRTVAKLPSGLFMGSASQVGFSAYSRLQREKDTARYYFFRSIEIVSFLTFPLLWGLASVADEAVSVFLGEKWIDAILVIQLLCLGMPARTLMRLFRPMLNAMGRPDLQFRNLLTSALCLMVGVAVGSVWGLTGVAGGWIAANLVAGAVNLGRTAPMLEASVGRVLNTLVPAILMSIAMCAAILAAKHYLLDDVAEIARLVLLLAIGATVYVGLAAMFCRQTLVTMISMLKN